MAEANGRFRRVYEYTMVLWLVWRIAGRYGVKGFVMSGLKRRQKSTVNQHEA